MIDWTFIQTVLLMPLGLIGFIVIINKLKELAYLKQGKVEVGFKKENFEITTDWIKPIDGKFNRKFGKIEREYNLSKLPGDCLYKGRKLFAIFDEATGEQISFRNDGPDKEELSSSYKSHLMKQCYLVGLNDGIEQSESQNLSGWFAVVAVILLALFSAYYYTSWDPIIKALGAAAAAK